MKSQCLDKVGKEKDIISTIDGDLVGFEYWILIPNLNSGN